MHPYLQCDRLVTYAQSLGMHVTAFSPMGHGQSYAPLGYGNNVAIKVNSGETWKLVQSYCFRNRSL